MTRTAALALVAFATVSPVRAEEQASPLPCELPAPERRAAPASSPTALVPLAPAPLPQARPGASAAAPVTRGSATTGSVTGMASYYGPGLHGRRKANGEIFNQNAMTAAHRTYAFGTRVRVTNLSNGRSVELRITDRGPFVRHRIIDVSLGAARALGFVNQGVARVSVARLSP